VVVSVRGIDSGAQTPSAASPFRMYLSARLDPPRPRAPVVGTGFTYM
jgi:hypothetical protein